MREAFSGAEYPLSTTLVFHPVGASLAFHTLSLGTALIALPFQFLIGLVPAYNLMYLLIFVGTAYGAYRLNLRMTGAPLVSVIAGLILPFGAPHMAQAQQHINFSGTLLLPFYILSLLRLADRPSLGRAVVSGLLLTGVSLLSWYYLNFSLYLTALFVIYWFFVQDTGEKRRRLLGALALALGITVVLLLPLLIPMVQGKLQGEFPALAAGQKGLSADLSAFFIPSILHPWFRHLLPLKTLYARYAASPEEGTVALGYGVLFLSIIGAWHFWRQGAKFWVLVALTFFLFALGPDLQILGKEPLPFTRLPYNWFVQKVPLLQAARAPSRYAVLVSLALGVLAAYGLRALRIRLRGRKGVGVCLLFGGLILFESWPAPVPVYQISPRPALYERLAAEEGDFAILNVPLRAWIDGERYLFAQTVHRRPIVSGSLSHIPRSAWRFIESDPFVRLLDNPAQIGPESHSVALDGLRENRIRYVLLHRNSLDWSRDPQALARVENLLNRRLERSPLSTAAVTAYRVP